MEQKPQMDSKICVLCDFCSSALQTHQTVITPEGLQTLGQDHIFVTQEQELSDQVTISDQLFYEFGVLFYELMEYYVHESGGQFVHPADHHIRWSDSSAPDDSG